MTRQTALSGVSVTRHVKDTTANFDVVYQEQAYILTRQGRAWDMLHAKMRDERAVKQHEQGGEGGAFDVFCGPRKYSVSCVAWFCGKYWTNGSVHRYSRSVPNIHV